LLCCLTAVRKAGELVSTGQPTMHDELQQKDFVRPLKMQLTCWTLIKNLVFPFEYFIRNFYLVLTVLHSSAQYIT
ncbi:MAG: hypothetical protein NTW16_09515, partial [Bacteroidetes bacterium]|nr:hypothetical protein [Bacteroidota bacterium]